MKPSLLFFTERNSNPHEFNRISLLISCVLFFYISFLLVVGEWASDAWIPLFVVCLGLVFIKRHDTVDFYYYEKILLLCLVGFFISKLFILFINGNFELEFLDYPFRFVMALAIYLAIRKFGVLQSVFIASIFFASFAAFLVAIYQVVFLNDFFATGGLHKIKFGGFSLLFSCFSIIMLIFKRDLSKAGSILLVFSFIFALIASVLSMSRGAWISIPVFLVFLFLLVRNFRANISLKHFVSFSIIFFTIAFSVFLLSPKLQSRMVVVVEHAGNYFDEDKKIVRGSTGTRLEMWKASMLMFQENIWLGVGIDEYDNEKNALIKDNVISKKIRQYSHPHSDYFLILAEQGLIGILFFISLMAGLFFSLFQCFRQFGSWPFLCGMWLVVAYLIYGLTEPYFRYQHSVVFFAFFQAVFIGMGFFMNQDHRAHG